VAEIRTVTTLTSKREEIERSIVGYEARLNQARADLAHINAAISIFEASGSTADMLAYANLKRYWKSGQLLALCKGFLKAEGPLDTRALSERVMRASGLNPSDKVLAQAVANRVYPVMRAQQRRGKIVYAGKRKAARIWALPQTIRLVTA
jgi:hypothetical protein